MAASDLTTVAFIYKKVYSDDQVADIATRDHVWYQMVEKVGGFTGTSFDYPIRYGNPQGISGTFSNAQSGAASSKGMQLSAARFAKFGVITLDGEAIAASEGNKGAFYDLVTMETDRVLEEMGDSFAFDFYRDGSGNRGQRASVSVNIVTLTTADDARNFKEGMTVIASSNADGSSPRAGSTTVASIDEDAGTVTLTSAAGITAFADNDYLFRAGDPATCMQGMEKCTPLTAPTAGDSFRGKDRSVNVKRLAGSRVADTNTSIEENLGLCAVKISQLGKAHNVDFGALNPINFWQVVRRLNAKVEYQTGGGGVTYGFEYVTISTPAGAIRLYSDPDCPTNRGRISRNGSQYIKTLRGLPHIVTDDGKPSLRQASANGIEARAVGWCNLIQNDTAAHGVIQI